MNRSNSKPLLYLFIRFLTLGLRFLFIALFFRYSEALYGEFSLVATTVMLGVYVLGLDFYTYAGRELLKPGKTASHIFLHQLLFYGFIYLITLPLFYLVFKFDFLDKSYLLLFYLLLIGEHLSFEIHRLLFLLKKPLAANINLFFRNGFWVIPLVFMFYAGYRIHIKTVLLFWVIGDILSLLPAGFLFGKKGIQSILHFRPDTRWIKKGILISIPFFLATLSFKVIEFSDRYFIDYFFDKKQVGIYSFFGNLSYLVNTVVYTAVISIQFPELVEDILSGNKEAFKEKFVIFRKKIIYWTLLSAAGVLLVMPIVLNILGKREHLQQYHVFVLLVLANVILNLSMIYHFVLYGFKKDKVLFLAAFTAMWINVGLNFIFIPAYGLTGAALTTLIAMLVIWLIKFISARKILKE